MIKKVIIVITALALVIGAILVNEFTTLGKKGTGFENVEVINDFKEGTHYTLIDEEKIKPFLEPLGIKEGQSFEIFSYSCPACYGMEPLAHAIDKQFKLNLKQVQLGFEGIPLAEVDYYINHFYTGKDIASAKLNVYNLMLDHAKTTEQKIAIVKNPSELIGVKETDITDELKVKAELYSKQTVALADALELRSTPAIYIGGKYLLNMSEIKSPNNLFRLMKKLKEEGKI